MFTDSLRHVFYIDYDLQFSSMLQNIDSVLYESMIGTDKLTVFQPSDDMLDFVGAVASTRIQNGGVMVLDSLNTLQNLLDGISLSRASRIANQKTALIVSVLENICRFYSKSLIIVNLPKSRPKGTSEDSSTFWEKTLVGGRMIRFKSDLILSAHKSKRDRFVIEIKVKDSESHTAGVDSKFSSEYFLSEFERNSPF